MPIIPLWPPPGYVTARAAAAQLGVTRQYLYALLPTVPEAERVQTPAGWLLSTRAVAQLRTRNTTRGRPRTAR